MSRAFEKACSQSGSATARKENDDRRPESKRSSPSGNDDWPSLPLEEWQATYATLHMWTQIVGKVRLQLTPKLNHWWNVPLYVSARGLTTSAMHAGARCFEIDFDFIHHELVFQMSDGRRASFALRPRPVAEFYADVLTTLRGLGIAIEIYDKPVEVPDPIPFPADRTHASYDPEYANRFWRILVQADRVFGEFRSRFVGKSSPVHFFWGSFDLAVTRFSGRTAPPREGADLITREAYSHEVISHGFWPGSGPIKGPAFSSWPAPEPPGLKEETIRPAQAFYSQDVSEFVLMYDDVRTAESPAEMLMEFLQSTYEAGAKLAKWDRASLER
ncbi:MAG: DUF5996 family protein [Pyrinomonadaceae bacterium]